MRKYIARIPVAGPTLQGIHQRLVNTGGRVSYEIRLREAFVRLADRRSPWFPIHLQQPDEAYVQANMAHHAAFVSTVAEYAARAAGSRTARLVEVGCGAGTMAIALSREHYSVYGIDFDPLLIAKARRLQERIGGFARFMAMDIADLPLWKTDSFDVAFSQGTLEHFHPDAVAEALHRQLDVARYVVLSVPSVDWPNREFGNERKLGIDEWTSLIEGAGLAIETMSYYGKERWHLQAVVSRPPA